MATKKSRQSSAEAAQSLLESAEAAIRSGDYKMARIHALAAEACWKAAEDYTNAARARGILIAINQTG